MSSDDFVVPDFSQVRYTVTQVAEMLGVSANTIKNYEEELELVVERRASGVQSRRYTLENIFSLAAHRRSRGLISLPARQITMTVHVKKGGVAKTTTAVNLAISFSLLGYRVLLIDNDPQGDSTTMLGFDPDLNSDELSEMGAPSDRSVEKHLGHLLKLSLQREDPSTLSEVLKYPFGKNGPHLIPADETLDDLNVALGSTNASDFAYGTFIKRSREGKYKYCDLSQYDIILFDCPPSSTLSSRNAIVACDYLITPLRMDRLSLKGLSRMASALTSFEDSYGRSPTPIVIPSLFQKNRPRVQRNLGMLMQHFGRDVTENYLHASEDFPKALDDGFPVILWKNAQPIVREEFRKLSKEIIQKIIRETGEKKQNSDKKDNGDKL